MSPLAQCLRIAAVASLVTGVATAPAQATIYIDQALTSLPANPGFTSVNLSGAPVEGTGSFTLESGALTVTLATNQVNGSNEGVVSTASSFNNANCVGSGGSKPCYGLSGVYAPPVTDAAGDYYQGNFFSTGSGTSTITLGFNAAQLTLALLWGSVDATNQIAFYNGTTLVGTVTGSQICSNCNGAQGFGGSYYVLLNSTIAFTKVVLTSGITSFESAEYETSPTGIYVPEPSAFGLLFAGLAALGLVRGRRAG
jgi:hypothetical protein